MSTATVGEGQICRHCSGWRDRVPGPTTCTAWSPVTAAAALAERLQLCVLPLLLLLSSLGPWAQLSWLGSGMGPLLNPQFWLLCVSSPLTCRCIDVWISLASYCVGQKRKLFLNYACFTRCRSKGRDRGNVSFHHDADVLVIIVFLGLGFLGLL